MDHGVVVIGAGLGGLRTVERLRSNGFPGPITLVGAERHAPYDRPPLTKQVLRGERDSTTLRADLDDLDARLLLGRRATALDPAARGVVLDDGSALRYDSIVLAPGGRARPLPGAAPRTGLHVIRTIDDALALRAAVSPGSKVVVAGGGFIGCEVAASLRAADVRVDLVEALPHPLARVLGEEGGRCAEELLVRHGVRVRTGLGVREVLGADRVTGVTLTDGTELPADQVVAGIGLVPELDWLDSSGIEVDDGIVCDAAGRTSVPNVYAVGDAARWRHPGLGEHRRVEHWTSTVDQAGTVAAVLTGRTDAQLDEVPYFWSDQFGVKIQALGFVDPGDTAHRVEPGGRTVLLYVRSGVLRAVVGFSAAKQVMRLRPLIAAGASLDDAVSLLTDR